MSEEVPNELARAFVYIEELGHHIETLVRATDAPGDEGTLFRIFTIGEELPPELLKSIREGNDHGTVVVDGVVIEVEFLFGWLGDLWNYTWGGIKSASGWVWKGATSAGSAIKTAASKTWNGSVVLSGWIVQGAEWSANQYVELLQRSYWTAYQEVQTAVNAVAVMGYGTVEGVKVLGAAVEEISKGNLIDGSAALFVGLAKIGVEMPLDVISTEVIESLANLQTMTFLEPIGRYLDDREKSFLKWVFKNGDDSWWINRIRVKEGFSGLWSLNPRPFTLETTIYFKNFAAGWTTARRDQLLTHETTHVWQFIHGGGDYKLESLYYQAKDGQGSYIWEPAVNNGTTWPNLKAEQQASFVEAAFANRCYDFSGTCIIGSVDRTAYFLNADHHVINGWGAP